MVDVGKIKEIVKETSFRECNFISISRYGLDRGEIYCAKKTGEGTVEMIFKYEVYCTYVDGDCNPVVYYKLSSLMIDGKKVDVDYEEVDECRSGDIYCIP